MDRQAKNASKNKKAKSARIRRKRLNAKFLGSLPENPLVAGVEICRAILGFFGSDPNVKVIATYGEILSAFGVLQSIVERLDLVEYKRPPELGSNRSANQAEISHYVEWVGAILEERLEEHYAELSVKAAKEKYSTKFGGKFVYEFSAGDLHKIQTLLNDLRNQITESTLFEEDHKSRLLKRLEALQSELHKKMSNLDKFWGLLGEAGIALGKFGNDAKPFVDRIREIVDIVWRTQSRAEELPTDTPLQLPGSDKESKDQ